MNALHPDVERLALLGWRLHPGSSHTRAACFAGATDLATCDLDTLDMWAWEHRGCSWRVVFQGSAIWGLDLDAAGPDHAADGMAAFRDLVARHGPVAPAPTLRSGGGGQAVFFRDTGAPIRGQTGWPAPGIDPRRGRQSQTVPPSRHHRTGEPYRWLLAPWEVSPPTAPAWLLRLMTPPPKPVLERGPIDLGANPDKSRRYALAALGHAVKRVASTREGGRNATLNREAYSLTRFMPEHLAPSEIADSLAVAARHIGLSGREVALTLASALRAGMRR